MKAVVLILFVLSITALETSAQFVQGERMKRRMDQSLRRSIEERDREAAENAKEEGALPQAKAAVMNVDVQMIASKADHKTFADAKIAEAKKVADGDPLWLYVKFRTRLGDYVTASRDKVDPEKIRYSLFIEIAPKGDSTALHQYLLTFGKDDLDATELKINLAPGLAGKNKSVPVLLMTSANVKSGVWNNEFRLTNKSVAPRALTDNLATASLTLDFSAGSAKYRKMDSEYTSLTLRGTTDLTKLPIAGTFYDEGVLAKVNQRLATEGVTPVKVYFAGDDWQEISSFGVSMNRSKSVFAAFTYRRGEACFYGVAKVVERYDFMNAKFAEPEIEVQKDLPVACDQL